MKTSLFDPKRSLPTRISRILDARGRIIGYQVALLYGDRTVYNNPIPGYEGCFRSAVPAVQAQEVQPPITYTWDEMDRFPPYKYEEVMRLHGEGKVRIVF